jgi:hypothetical protein
MVEHDPKEIGINGDLELLIVGVPASIQHCEESEGILIDPENESVDMGGALIPRLMWGIRWEARLARAEPLASVGGTLGAPGLSGVPSGCRPPR